MKFIEIKKEKLHPNHCSEPLKKKTTLILKPLIFQLSFSPFFFVSNIDTKKGHWLFNPLTKLHVIKIGFELFTIQVISANLPLKSWHCIDNDDTLVWTRTLHIIWINIWFWELRATNYSEPFIKLPIFTIFFHFCSLWD